MAQAVVESANVETGDRTEYRLYICLAYPLFLIAALLGRVFSPSSARAGGKPRRSVFHEATDMALSVIPWVFSGR